MPITVISASAIKATATYPAMAAPTDVRVCSDGGGRVTVECATHDLGTGMYTIIAQVAADTLGIPLAHVTVKIGDSAYPKAPVAGGSQSTASVNHGRIRCSNHWDGLSVSGT